MVVVHRRSPGEPEFLVLRRSPERQGYWHLVAGALDDGEDAAGAAARELREETGLEAAVVDLDRRYLYALDDEPTEVRSRFAANVTEIAVAAFTAEAPSSWEPVLDEEHVEYRWCSASGAIVLLRYPEPQDAVREAARRLGEARR